MRELDGTGIAVAGALSTAFGCPFEGEQVPGRVMEFVGRLRRARSAQRHPCRHTGMGHPKQVLDLCTAVRERWPELELALHFHTPGGWGSPTCSPDWRQVSSITKRAWADWRLSVRPWGDRKHLHRGPGSYARCMGYTTGVNLDKLLWSRSASARSSATICPAGRKGRESDGPASGSGRCSLDRRHGTAREHQGTWRSGQPAGALRDARAQPRDRSRGPVPT